MTFTRIARSVLYLVLAFSMFSEIAKAEEGRIKGSVIELETGAPVAAARVIVLKTSIESITNENGEYSLSSVPAGRQILLVSCAECESGASFEVMVRPGLVTFQDFVLPLVSSKGDRAIIPEVMPVKPGYATFEILSLFGEEIDKMPIRGVEAVIAMTPGVIRINDDFHLRGGRSDEMNSYLDGINISSALGGSVQIPVIPNAIEAVTVLPGGFPAEYGGKMSGMASVRLKTGGSKYKISGEVITDDFWAFKNGAGSHQILGIDKLYSFGYNDYILTLSGPVIPWRDDLRFFIAGQASNRMSSATWFEGFHQDLIPLPGVWASWHGQQYRDTLDLVMDVPPGRLPGGGREWKTLQGNLLWNFKSLRFKMGWTRHRGRSNPETADPRYLISTPIRSRKDVQRIDELHFNMSHSVNSSLYYSVRAGMVSVQSEFGDPVWWENWLSYGDPGKNPALIDTSQKHGNYQLCFDPQFRVPYPGTPYGTYGKDEEKKLTAAFDLTKRLGRIHELKIGGEFIQSKLRRFRFDALKYMKRFRDVGLDPESYTEYDVYSYLAAFFGYDWFGNEIEEDMVVSTKLGQPYPVEVNLKNGPPKPIYAGFYIQDRIEYEKLIINAGVRLEYMKNGLPALKSLTDFAFDRLLIDEENWVDQKSYNYLSPRVGFSFAATKHTVFHVQAGRYIQPPDLSQMWIMTGYDPSSFRNLSYGQGFYPHLNPNLKPSQTLSYEIGLHTTLGRYVKADLTAFYKDIKDLTAYRVLQPTISFTRPSTFIMNADFATVKGVSVSIDVQTITRMNARVYYTYSVSEGTGSSFDDHIDIASQEEDDPYFPNTIYPLDFDIRHKGSVIFNFRTMPNDGFRFLGKRPLGNLGLALKFDFHSGKPYTRIPIGDGFSEIYGYSYPPPAETFNNSRFPWFFQLDGKLDKSFTFGPVRFNVYIWAINVLGRKGIIEGFRQTGRPDTDGWLKTDAGEVKLQRMNEWKPEYVNWYQGVLTQCGTYGWQMPRQVRLGLRFEIY